MDLEDRGPAFDVRGASDEVLGAGMTRTDCLFMTSSRSTCRTGPNDFPPAPAVQPPRHGTASGPTTAGGRWDRLHARPDAARAGTRAPLRRTGQRTPRPEPTRAVA